MAGLHSITLTAEALECWRGLHAACPCPHCQHAYRQRSHTKEVEWVSVEEIKVISKWCLLRCGQWCCRFPSRQNGDIWRRAESVGRGSRCGGTMQIATNDLGTWIPRRLVDDERGATLQLPCVKCDRRRERGHADTTAQTLRARAAPARGTAQPEGNPDIRDQYYDTVTAIKKKNLRFPCHLHFVRSLRRLVFLCVPVPRARHDPREACEVCPVCVSFHPHVCRVTCHTRRCTCRGTRLSFQVSDKQASTDTTGSRQKKNRIAIEIIMSHVSV